MLLKPLSQVYCILVLSLASSVAESMLSYYGYRDEVRNRKFLNIIFQRLSHLSGMIENVLPMSVQRFNSIALSLLRISF